MSQVNARGVSSTGFGIAAITVGLLGAVSLFMTVTKFWSRLGVHRGLSVNQVMLGLQVQSALGAIVTAILVTWISFGVWRLAIGRPGATALMLALAASILYWAVLAALALTTYLTSKSGLPVQSVFLLGILLPDVLRFGGWLLLALGLLRSHLVPRWVAGLGAAASVITSIGVALTAPAYWHMAALGPLEFGAAIARYEWVANVASVLFVGFWVALGVTLLARREAAGTTSSPDVAEA